jgi:SAM-dependent methyltransferase
VLQPGSSSDAEYLLADLAAAESWHFWFLARRKLALWALQAHFPWLRNLLEVGCGTGFVLSELRRSFPADVTLAGCDIRFDAVSAARHRLRQVTLFQGDVLRLPVQRRFDAIAALDVIEHVDDDRKALSEMFNVLKPGGGLLVTVPQHPWLWSEVDEFSRHRRRYRRRDLLEKARAAGFEVLRCTSFFSSTMPLMVVSRLRRRGDAFDAAAELRIPRALNAVAAALLQPEWLLVRAGVSLPIGSSLVVVARRPLS